MPRGTHTFNFSKYLDKVVDGMYFAVNDSGYEEIDIVFSDGTKLVIYSEDLQFEHTTVEGEDR